jgi:hypothetical protein
VVHAQNGEIHVPAHGCWAEEWLVSTEGWGAGGSSGVVHWMLNPLEESRLNLKKKI